MCCAAPESPKGQPKRRGIVCPTAACGGKLVPGSRAQPLTGLRVRYFRCTVCRTRVKTVERVVSVRRPDPPPDTLPTSAPDFA
jgi:hypothetical protein